MKIKLFILAYAFSAIVNAQNWQWTKQAQGPKNSYASGVAVDHFKNSYVTGFFTDTVYFGAIRLVSNGAAADIFIAKYDSTGKILWAKSAGSTATDAGWGIAVDSLCNVYITGSFAGQAYFDTIVLSNSGGRDAFIAKYNPTGKAVWAISGTSDPSDEDGRSIYIDKYGYLYACGEWQGQSVTFGTITLSSSYLSDQKGFIVKFDKNGIVIWAKMIDSGLSGSAIRTFGIAVDTLKNAYITGYVDGKGVFGTTTINATSGTTTYLTKIDSSKTFAWTKSYGLGNISALDIDNIGNIYLANNTPSSGAYINKITPAGNTIWSKLIGPSFGSNQLVLEAICSDKTGNCYFTGIFYGTDSFAGDTLISAGGNIFVAGCDSSGKVLWGKRAGGTKNDYGYGIRTDNIGNCYVAGSISSSPANFDTITLSATGTGSMFVGKIDTNSMLLTAGPAIATQPSCYGQCNGTATIYPNGGATPYSYSWSDGETTRTASSLCMGTYTVTVTDANTSKSTSVISITQPPMLTSKVTVSPTATICSGLCTSIYSSTSGGTSGYSYTWMPGSVTTSSISACPASTTTYSLKVTDAKGCNVQDTITITVNPSPTVTITTPADTICKGGSTILYGSGGNTYSWGGGQTTSSISVSPTSNTTYYLTGNALNGCSTTASIKVYVQVCTGIDDINTDENITIYPNPFSTYTIFVFPEGLINQGNVTLKVYDILGREVNSIVNINTRSVTLYKNILPSGVYFFKVYLADNIISLGKMIIE